MYAMFIEIKTIEGGQKHVSSLEGTKKKKKKLILMAKLLVFQANFFQENFLTCFHFCILQTLRFLKSKLLTT